MGRIIIKYEPASRSNYILKLIKKELKKKYGKKRLNDPLMKHFDSCYKDALALLHYEAYIAGFDYALQSCLWDLPKTSRLFMSNRIFRKKMKLRVKKSVASLPQALFFIATSPRPIIGEDGSPWGSPGGVVQHQWRNPWGMPLMHRY